MVMTGGAVSSSVFSIALHGIGPDTIMLCFPAACFGFKILRAAALSQRVDMLGLTVISDLHFSAATKRNNTVKRAELMEKNERLLLEGERFNVHQMELNGSDGKIYHREVIRHPGAVVLLPLIDPDTVVLIRNHRATVGETLLELPAGTREPDESPTQTAARELIEETGYRAGNLLEMCEFYSAPGICDELMHLFVARDLAAGEHAREAVEQIENQLVHRNEIRQLIADGGIRDAKTLVGLYAFLFSDRLNVK